MACIFFSIFFFCFTTGIRECCLFQSRIGLKHFLTKLVKVFEESRYQSETKNYRLLFQRAGLNFRFRYEWDESVDEMCFNAHG